MLDLNKLLAAPNVYEAFNALEWGEIQEDLAKLTEEDATTLINAVIISCPKTELSRFKIKVTSNITSTAGNFSKHLTDAITLTLNIKAMVDSKNATPYVMLTSRFPDLFAQYPGFAAIVLSSPQYKGAYEAFRKKLKATPPELRSKLLENLTTAFSEDHALVISLTSQFGRVSGNMSHPLNPQREVSPEDPFKEVVDSPRTSRN